MPLFSSVEWADGQQEAFVSWMRRELFQTEGDREDLERTWENRILAWRAKMTDVELDFPYPGASNLELPLISMHADPVLADFIQTFHASSDYWSPTATRRDRVDHAAALRRGLTAIEKKWLKMRRVNLRAFLDNIVLGTAVYKNSWKSERAARRRYTQDGSSDRVIEMISHPSIEHVPLQRLWFPAYAWSLDFDAPGGTPWIAQEFRWSEEEWARFSAGSSELPGFDSDAAEVVKSFLGDDPEAIRDVTVEEDEFEPFEKLRHQVFEVWARFDTRGTGVYDDIMVLFHPSSGQILRAIYFPNAHGRHPFHAINYLPGYGIYGIGLAEVDEWAQEASTQLLNAQIDNARLANTRMFSAPIGSMHQPNEAIYPGKVWYLEPDERISEIRLSDLYPSGFTLMNQLVQFSEQRSGVNELRQGGMGGMPSRTPATSLLTIMREGNKRFDMIHTGVRDVHSEMGLRMTQNVAQRAAEDPMSWMSFFERAEGPEDAQKIMQVLLEGEAAIEESFGINVTATSASVNKEVEKQSFIGMLQIAQQIYGSLVQTAMLHAQVPDPIVQATARASFISGVEILGQLLERFDVKNKDEHLGNLEVIANTLKAQDEPGGNAATAGMMGQQQGMMMPQSGAAGAGGPVDPGMIAAMLGLA
jgi:hypothetical protein